MAGWTRPGPGRLGSRARASWLRSTRPESRDWRGRAARWRRLRRPGRPRAPVSRRAGRAHWSLGRARWLGRRGAVRGWPMRGLRVPEPVPVEPLPVELAAVDACRRNWRRPSWRQWRSQCAGDELCRRVGGELAGRTGGAEVADELAELADDAAEPTAEVTGDVAEPTVEVTGDVAELTVDEAPERVDVRVALRGDRAAVDAWAGPGEQQHDHEDAGRRQRSLHRCESDATRYWLHEQLPLDERPGRSPTLRRRSKPRAHGNAVRPPPYSPIGNRTRAGVAAEGPDRPRSPARTAERGP